MRSQAIRVDTYRENERYNNPDFNILVNVSQIVYIQNVSPLHLMVLTSGSFYINEEDAAKVKEAMIFGNS